jgi:hypothetical protein
MKKEFLLFFASLLFSVIFAIVFLEIYFKSDFWSGNFFTHNGRNHNTEFDSKLGWSNTPKVSYVEDDVTYTFNSSGFRSKEVDLSKKHILVVGDSIALGYGVQDDETLSYYLNSRFKEYQVLNMGVVGYGIDQYYLNLKKYVDKLNPALIIIIICMANDKEGTASDARHGKSKPLFVIDRTERAVKSGRNIQSNSDNLLLTNSNISPNSCTNIFTKSWTLRQPFFWKFRTSICNTRTLNVLELDHVILSLLYKIEGLAKEKKSKLLFALSPPEIFDVQKGGNMGKSDLRHITYFQKVFKNLNFSYVDFYKTIKNQDSKNEDLYVDGLHFSSLGNELFANSIYSYIKNSRLISVSIG